MEDKTRPQAPYNLLNNWKTGNTLACQGDEVRMRYLYRAIKFILNNIYQICV